MSLRAFLEYVYSIKFKKDTRSIGFKIFPDQNDQLMWNLIKEPSIKKIVLIRTNYLMNYLSFLTARETHLFFVNSGSSAKDEDLRIRVDYKKFLNYERNQKSFFNDVIDELNRTSQNYCEIHYEELLIPDHQKRLLAFLGVHPVFNKLNINSEKQAKLPLDQKIINYEELAEKLMKAGKGDYLKGERLIKVL